MDYLFRQLKTGLQMRDQTFVPTTLVQVSVLFPLDYCNSLQLLPLLSWSLLNLPASEPLKCKSDQLTIPSKHSSGSLSLRVKSKILAMVYKSLYDLPPPTLFLSTLYPCPFITPTMTYLLLLEHARLLPILGKMDSSCLENY